MTAERQPPPSALLASDRWLTLGQACRLLNVETRATMA